MIKAFTIALSLIVSVAVSGSDPVKERKSDLKCTFTGKVLDKTNLEALTGAVIEIRELEKTTYASLDGSFSFENTPVGKYTVVVKYLGYVDQVFSDVLISPVSGNEKFQLTSY